MKISASQNILLASACVGFLLLLTACQTRSISDSGYRKPSFWGGDSHYNPSYRGELNEFDLLGLRPDVQVSDEEIKRALDSAQSVRLRKGSQVMLIQSGAYVPDESMVQELNGYFNIIPFSGQPRFNIIPFSGRPEDRSTNSYSATLRLAAAQAGCDSIVCYWGTLESARDRHGTKVASWVPVLGGVIPDETQHMRIRLKIAVMDTRTGNWSMFTPAAFEHKALSGKFSRESSDQTQVEKLKKLAYAAAVKDMALKYSN